MKRRSVAVFCMADRGHFGRVFPLVSTLSKLGAETHVFSHQHFRAEIEQAGGRFVDLFAAHSVADADDESWPIPVRYVSFAGRYADAIGAELAALAPSVVIHDTFAVVGVAVANLLGIPHVNLCAGHNVAPRPFLAFLEGHPRVRVSAKCLDAVEALRTRYGLYSASPFSYVSALSPHLNLYCEPPQFLAPADRGVFEPLAFYGSLPAPEEMAQERAGAPYFAGSAAGELKVYVSFGTVIWSVRRREALLALKALAASLARVGGVRAAISLGGEAIGREDRQALSQPGVSVHDYVEQWRILQEADAFFTHHGLNSTHEAIWHRVPLVSYPFGWDQPGQARTCQRLGLAIPLTPEVMGEITDEHVKGALSRLRSDRVALLAALSEAREWERAVIAARPAVVEQVLALGG